MATKTLVTDKTFLMLSIPHPPEREEMLEKSLLREGCRMPIITWNGVIIDGHKRYRFCSDEGLDYSVEEVNFPSEEEAVSWVCRNRIGEFDKKSPAYRYLVGKLYIARKQIYREEKNLPETDRSVILRPEWDRVSCSVGEELQVHRATIEHYGMYAAAMDQLAEKSWQLFRAILAGVVVLTFKETRECAAMDERRIKEYCRKKWDMQESRDSAEKIRNRRKKDNTEQQSNLIPLAVGIKQMPAYDPDMEIRGLTLTIPTWIMAISRAEGKIEQATDQAKDQLSRGLSQLKEQIEKVMGELYHG